MIRFIAVIDSKYGMANDHGIPWQGLIPTDTKFFREKTRHNNVLMGFVTYKEFDKPLSDRENYVAVPSREKIRHGFKQTHDPREFLKRAKEDVWVIGGAGLFASVLDLADELYITRVEGDFKCTKFFPKFEQDFTLAEQSKPSTENDIIFHFEIWKKNK